MKMYRLFFMALAVLEPHVHTLAQSHTDSSDNKVKFSFTGSADVYYKYNFNKNNSDTKTSFTNAHNTFAIGMISGKLETNYKKAGLVVDIGFGQRAEEFTYNDANTRMALKQLYLSYDATDWLRFEIGTFGTFVGYELVDAYLNRNYSMSYMFSFGPFFHTGFKSIFSKGAHSLMVGLFNPTDFKTASFTGIKAIGAQYGYTPEDKPYSFYLNYLGSRDTLQVRNDQLDAVFHTGLSSKFGLGLNATYSNYKNGINTHWAGAAVYLEYDPMETFGLTLRAEYLEDKDNIKLFDDAIKYPIGGEVLAFTLSGNVKIGGLTIIPEFRLDRASQGIFTKESLSNQKISPNLLLAAVYKF
jgi:hypothetical protein